MDSDTKQRREELRLAPLDGQVLKKLTEAGLAWLRTNQQTVNALNVFPVPDGDTGTNMVLTMQAAWDEIADSSEHNVGKLAHAIAHGALMGARGNSGVILSQLWRGFARSLDSQDILDGESLVRAFAQGRDTAYKGVVRPVEGTILTVAKDVAASAEKAITITQNPFDILEYIIPDADRSVLHTPELLPVLKEAGVVDSGGKGLFFLLEGMVRYLNNQPLDTAVMMVKPLAAMTLEDTLETIEPGQDCEVVIDFRPHAPLDLAHFYNDLEQIGTSIQIGEGEGMYRLHIHVTTDKQYAPIEYISGLGTWTKIAMENLLAQMEDLGQKSSSLKLELAQVEPDQIAVIAVAPGAGIARVFASLGVAAIVEGGQTMNPSTQEIIQAFEDLPTDKIIVLPNNKNIILAAKAAAELTTKKVCVIPSRTVPQGLAAIMRLTPGGELEEVAEEMTAALEDIQTGEITTATRTVEIDNLPVQEGQIIGLLNGKLTLAAATVEEACLALLAKADTANYELVTLFYGDNIAKTEVDHIVDLVRQKYPSQEIEVQDGGQPHYHFIIAIE